MADILVETTALANVEGDLSGGTPRLETFGQRGACSGLSQSMARRPCQTRYAFEYAAEDLGESVLGRIPEVGGHEPRDAREQGCS